VTTQTTSYVYDMLGRVLSATTPGTTSMPTGWTQGFVFDGFGNLVQKAGSGEASGAAFDIRPAMTYPALAEFL
jgi:hypothetical protein